MKIKEVKTRSALRQFVRLPFKIYRHNSYWVPPLIRPEINTFNPNKNPAFDHCSVKLFLALKDGRPVGRIAGIINHRYVEAGYENHARFGWVDFIDEPDVSKGLFDRVEAWAKKEGVASIQGPLGFSNLDRTGMLVEGFNELGTFSTIYNHAYYPEHLTQLGYQKLKDWLEYQIDVPQTLPKKLERGAALVRKRYKLRSVPLNNKRDMLAYANQLFQLINVSFQHLYGFIPFSQDQFDLYARQYLGYLRPDFVSFIVDEHDQLVGFGITSPSLGPALRKANGHLYPFGIFHLLRAMRHPKEADLHLIGVRPEWQKKGVTALIFQDVLANFIENGVTKVNANPEYEDNYNVQALWKPYNARQHKRRRCFFKELEMRNEK